SRRRHTRFSRDWSSDVCSSDLFVMAEFLQVSYGQVILWALIPALLYYLACFAAVHFEAKRHGIMGLPRSELPKLGNVMRERGHRSEERRVGKGGRSRGWADE